MTRTYKFVVDYDGTCDWSGTNRELEFYIESFELGDYTMDGTVYRRVRMPWDTNKALGSREFRRKNLTLSINAIFDDQDAVRLFEGWTLLFPSLWEPTRGFDYISYYNGATNVVKAGIVERPQSIATTIFTTSGQHWYFGSLTGKFDSIDTYMSQNGVGGTYVWEYSTGDDTWTTLTVTNGTWIASNVISWTPPSDWIASTMTILSNADPLFLVRCRCTGNPSTEPRIRFMKRHRPISAFLMVSDDGGSTWEFWHRKYSSDAYFPNGWCIRSFIRSLKPGEPSFFSGVIELLEANY